ncbi:P-loop containing nucleoside triphosphate hydrolase protein [Piromyces finnis]|uniref:DNA repair protein RAD51 homolog 3 n=1 Tax=Piromyces finnis TaxID=1754191 RepID=A0A1Y1VKL8_9FUNG|nr:P-loop containing nucleoside triphosphate hydrolase protein [Piromyces finnis]|eukprot:ORX58624.1 P-loop containing nucleoside triphosphate hydrolase protein [Piromyces finnis]
MDIFNRSITTLNINSDIKAKLLKLSICNINDLKYFTPTKLAEEINIPVILAESIFEQINYDNIKPISGLELYTNELKKINSIQTFCKALDNMLEGVTVNGIPLGKITEFCGPPGIGKTQLGIQLSVNVQIPKMCKGIEGKAIFIDTEGSFMIERVIQIANSTVDYIKENYPNYKNDSFNLNSILSNIQYFRVHDFQEQIALINILENYIISDSMIKVIVIDSIAFHFRQTFSSMSLRTQILNNIAQILMKIADKYNIAIVIMNQMTMKFQRMKEDPANKEESLLVPALGESWGHASTNRFILSTTDDQMIRKIFLQKSPNNKQGIAYYQITNDGVRDV